MTLSVEYIADRTGLAAQSKHCLIDEASACHRRPRENSPARLCGLRSVQAPDGPATEPKMENRDDLFQNYEAE